MSFSAPNPLVIDSGVGYALCSQDESSATVRAKFNTLVGQGVLLYAPSIWQFEFTSILTKAVHFRQLSENSARQVFQLSEELRILLIHPDPEMVLEAFDWTLRLKRAAAYDSFYLALAQRLKCELWTIDRRLVNAAAVPWVHYVGNTA